MHAMRCPGRVSNHDGVAWLPRCRSTLSSPMSTIYPKAWSTPRSWRYSSCWRILTCCLCRLVRHGLGAYVLNFELRTQNAGLMDSECRSSNWMFAVRLRSIAVAPLRMVSIRKTDLTSNHTCQPRSWDDQVTWMYGDRARKSWGRVLIATGASGERASPERRLLSVTGTKLWREAAKTTSKICEWY